LNALTSISYDYENRPIAEIIDVSPTDRDELIDQAERLIFEIYQKRSDGGVVTDFFRAMVRSIVELLARQEAMVYTNKCSIIDIESYRKAFDIFRNNLMSDSNNLELYEDFWIKKIKDYLNNFYLAEKKVFETFLIGCLCENFYLNIKGSKAVINQLLTENFLKIDGSQYGKNLIIKM